MQDILKRVNEKNGLKKLLIIASMTVTVLSVVAFVLVIYTAYVKDVVLSIKLLAMSAIPFVAVSLLRHLVDTKRPYEVYDFYKTPPKNKRGRSFPSRHVFSSFLIATLLFTVSAHFAIPFYILGLILALCRVLLGIHFIRDVVAGGAIGIISGVIALLLI